MESIIVAINIILAIILVVVVLLQRSEGGALGLGVSQDNYTSSRSVGTFLTKLTTLIASLFIICECKCSGILIRNSFCKFGIVVLV